MTMGLSNLTLITKSIFGNYDYFLDFGTLLGFVRENNILENDDYDFGVIEPSLETIDNFYLRLIEIGYTPKKIYYNNSVVMIKAFSKNGLPSIDIHIYKINRDNIYFPLYHTPKINSIFLKILRRVIRYIYCFFTLQFNNFVPLNLSNFILNKLLFRIKFVVQPLEYVLPIINYKGFNVPIRYEDYLEMRYGAWRIKDLKYYFWVDQKDLYESSPK